MVALAADRGRARIDRSKDRLLRGAMDTERSGLFLMQEAEHLFRSLLSSLGSSQFKIEGIHAGFDFYFT